jgi:monoamine oxidase
MDVERGLIMISYTDNDYTQYWKNIQTNQNKLKSAVVSLVKDTFDMDIARPIKVIVCHWECGVAYWNKNVDSDFTSKLLCNPSQNVYICGENYSLNQSWVEGALETCETAYKKFMLNQGTISESR